MATADSFLTITVRFRRRNIAWIREHLYTLPPSKIQRQFADGMVTIRAFSKIASLLRGVVAGVYSGNVWIAAQEGPGGVLPATYPAGTITCTQANAANDTITFNWGGQTVVLTESATLTGPNFFNRGANDAACAQNLAACINRHPTLGGMFGATVATNVVTVTSKLPGAMARNTSMSTSDGTAFALVQVTGGAEGGAAFFPTQIWVNKAR